jgi:hypothetical protein
MSEHDFNVLCQGIGFIVLLCAGWKVLEWLYGRYHLWRWDCEPPPDNSEFFKKLSQQIYEQNDPGERAAQIMRERRAESKAESKAKPISKDVQEPDVLRRTTKEFSEQFQSQQLDSAQAERLERMRQAERNKPYIAAIERLEARLAIEQAELARAAKATRLEK